MRNRFSTYLAAALTGLLAASAPAGAAVQGEPLVEGTAATAAIAGAFALDGLLASFHSDNDGLEATPSGPSGAPPMAPRIPPAHLGLSARLLHVETDIERYDATTVVTVPSRDVERLTFASVQGASQPAREGFSFFLAPQPGHPAPTVHVEGVAATAAVDADGMTEHQPRWVPTQRPMLSTPTGPIIAISNDGLRTLRIEGDFVLTMWEWDMMLNSPTDSALVTSGFTGQSYLPALPEPIGDDTLGQDFEERQVFLYAEDAVLDVTLPVGSAASMSVLQATGLLDGRIRLAGPEASAATRDGDASLQDGDWVDGDLELDLRNPTEDAFAFAIGGEAREARVAGRTATLARATDGAAGPMWWAAALAGIAVGAGAAVALRRRSDARQAAAVKRLLDAGDYDGVVKGTTPRLLRLRRFADSIRTQRAVAQLVLGRPNDAARTLDGWRSGHEATRDYLWACVHAARGETAAAAARLQACMQRDPVLARQLLADPVMGQAGGARSGGSAATTTAATPSRAATADDARTEGYV